MNLRMIMNGKNNTLSSIILAISMIASPTIFARGAGGFNEGNHDLNNDGYNNSFYYNKHLNDNDVVFVPDDSDMDTTCQTTQVCDSSGNCVTQQNCN